MKKSNKKIHLFLIIGIVLLATISLGTALVSSLLNISGKTTIKENSWVIYFDSVRKSTDSVTATEDARITNFEKTRIDFSVNLTEPGDFYEFTVYTVNDGSIDAMVDSVDKSILTENQLKYLDFSVTYDNGREIKRCDALDAHTRKRIKAIVKFKDGVDISDYPTEETNLDLFFDINYVQKDNACPEDPTGNEKLLTIKPNGGKYKGRGDETRIYIETGSTYEIEEPVRFLYNFTGWEVINPESDGTYTFSDNIFTMGNEDVTIEAQWEEGAYVARIMNKYFPSIQEAFDAVDSTNWEDNTVYLLKNQNEDPINNATNPFVFNLGGYTVTGQIINPKDGTIGLVNGKVQAEEDQQEAFINYGSLTLGTQGGGVQVENSIALIGNEVGLRNVNKNGNYGDFYFYDGYIEAVAALVGGYTELESGYYIFSEHIPERNDQRVYLVKNPNRAVAKTTTDGVIYYYNLQDAINQASINKRTGELPDTDYIITVVRNFEAAYKLQVKENETIVIDLDGHNVSTGDTITNNGSFTILNTSQVTSTIKSSREINNNSNLYLNNINLKATADSNVINNTSNLNLTNVNIESRGGYGVNNSDVGTITLDSNTIINSTASYGINNTGENLVINNGTTYGIKNSNTITIDGNAIVHNGNESNAISNTGTVIINNGELSSNDTRYVIDTTAGTVTVNGGNISNNQNTVRVYSSTIYINDGTISAANGPTIVGNGTTVVNGGTVTSGSGRTITSNTFTMNGGNVIGEEYAASVVTFTMTGGTITATEVGVSASNSNVSGGTINAGTYGINTDRITMTDGNVNASNGIGILLKTSGTITGGTIFGDTYGVQAKKQIDLGANDKTISSTAPVLIGNLYGLYIEGNDINFYDGILKGQTDGYFGKITGLPTGGLIAEGVEDINGVEFQTDTITAFKNWLRVGEEVFNNIDDACDAITSSGTIEVIDDADVRFIQNFTELENHPKNITFDLNGFSITTTQPIYNKTTLIITDSSDNKTGTITATRVNGLINEKDANVTINAGNFISTQEDNNAIENKGIMIINAAHVQGEKSAMINKGTLTINDITIDNSQVGITHQSGTTTINDGNIQATNMGISKTDTGTVYVRGGYIYGENYGIGGGYGNAYVSGGLVKATNNNAIYSYYGELGVSGGQVISENNIAMDGHSDMFVSGGYVEGTEGVQNEQYCTWNTCWYNDISVSGGHIVGLVGNGLNARGPSTGETTITGGVIEGKINGVYSTARIRIGTDNSSVSTTSPVLIGHTDYGLLHSNYTEFYDGILKGIKDGHNGLISIIPDAHLVKDDYEYIDKVEYQTDYLVEKGNWLRVGSQEFNSINEAKKHITSENNTMTVIADAYIDFAQTLTGSNVIFDFNGHSLIMTQPITVKNNTTFINSTGVGGINNLRDYALKIENENGNATIAGGVFHSDTTDTIYNGGYLTVTDGTIKADYQSGIYNTGRATINGGTIESLNSAVGIKSSNELIITKGTITAVENAIEESNGSLTVNGGTITSTNNNGIYINSSYYYRPTIEINGGTITGNKSGIVHTNSKGDLVINNGHIIGETVNGVTTGITTNIYGGTLEGAQYGLYTTGSSDTTTIGRSDKTINIDTPILKGDLYGLYITSPYTVNFYDGIIKGLSGRHAGIITSIEEHSQIFEDEEVIDEQTYLTEYLVTQTDIVINEDTNVTYGNLQDAITQARNGQTLRLLTNVPLYYEIRVTNNPNVTLNLDGHTISTNKPWHITVPFTLTNTSENESTLKISTAVNLITTTTNLTINNINLKNTSSSNYVLNNTGKLTLNNVNIDCIDGIQSSNELVINNTNITATKNTISNTGKMTIDGGTYTGDVYCMYSNSSKIVDVSNATFNGVYYNGGNNVSTLSNSTVNGNLQNNTSEFTVNSSYINEGRITNNGIMTMNDSTFTAITYTTGYYYNQSVAMSNTNELTLNRSNVYINTTENGKNSIAIYNDNILNILDNSKVYIGIENSNNTYKAIETENRGLTTIDASEIKATGGNTNYAIYMNSDNAKTIAKTGNIISEYASNGYGAYIEKGTFEMGEYEGMGASSEDVSITTPLVYAYGKSRGIGVKKINGSFNFYDGIIRASKYAKPETTTNVEYQFEVTTYVDENTGFEYAILEYMRNDYQGDTVCLLNGVYYKTVQDAINKTVAGDEITLLKSVEEDLTIPATMNFKLNLNKHSITTELINNGTLQVYNGSLQSFEHTTITNRGTLIMGENDGNVSSSNIRIISEATTIKNTGTLVVYDGYIEGHQAVEGKINTVAQYARIRTEHDDQSEKKYIQSLSPEAIISGETDLIITIDPNSGYYNGSKEIQEIFKKYQETYTFQTPTKNGCIFTGWELSDDTNYDSTTSTITVDISDITAKAIWQISDAAIAKVGDEYYLSLQEALDAANDNDIVELIKNTTEDITNRSNVTLDLGGYTVTGAFINQGELKVINGTIENPNGVGLVNRKLLSVGENDGEIHEEYVKIIGTTVGLQQEARFRFYDGYIEGDIALFGKVDAVPQGYFLYNDHNNIKDCQRVYLIGNPANAVAVIDNGGTQYFFSLQDAIDTATITSDEIYVVRNFEATYPITTQENSNVTINMAGFTITAGNQITNNGTLTIHDTSEGRGTINNAKTIINNGTLNIDSVNVTANTNSIDTFTNHGILNTRNTSITSNNGYCINTDGDLRVGSNTETHATKYSIYNNQSIPLEISTGEIDCINNATELILSGDVTIEKNDSNAYGIQFAKENAKVTINNATIRTSTRCIYSNYRNTTLIINDGYFHANTNQVILDDYNNISENYKSFITINGGTFESENTSTLYTEGTDLKVTGGTFITNYNGNGHYGILCYNSYCDIKGATIRAERASGIYIDGNSGPSNIEDCNIYANHLNAYGIRLITSTTTIKNNIVNTPRISSYGIYIDNNSAVHNATLEGNDIKSGNVGIYNGQNNNYTNNLTIKSGKVYGATYGIFEEGQYANVVIGTTDSSSITDPEIKGDICAIHKLSGNSTFYSGRLVGTTCGYDNDFNAIKSRMEISTDEEVPLEHQKLKTQSVLTSSAYPESEQPKEGNGHARITYIGESTAACEQNEATDFEYKEREETMTVRCSGRYKLEVWGAQGGSYNATSTGGFGGYSKGEIDLVENEILYVNVGGAGINGRAVNNHIDGGYNGGGDANSNSSNIYISSGGGATHIATTSGLLSTLENNKDKILIVAGGGGGSVGTYTRGGSGGGYIGGKGTNTNEASYTNYYATGGTQNSGGYYSEDSRYGQGTFGKGGNAAYSSTSFYGGGGGGGFYGGAASMRDVTGAGGGSGYTANPRIINPLMVGYKVQETASTNVVNYLTEKEPFLKVNDEPFSSMNEAIAYIDENLNKVGTIKVIKSAESSEATTITEDENITIDLNNKTLTLTQFITNNGTLTITDLSDDKTGELKAPLTQAIKNNKELIVSNATVNAPGYTAINNTNTTAATTTITNSTIKGNTASTMTQFHTFNATNSTFETTGNTFDVTSRSNVVTLTNCTVTSTTAYAYNGSYGHTSTNYYNKLNIIGGTITGATHGIYLAAQEATISGAKIITTSTNKNHYAIYTAGNGPMITINDNTELIAENASGIYEITNLTVDGMKITSKSNGIKYPANGNNVAITMKNVEITSDATGIFIEEYDAGGTQTFVIENGTIYGKEYGIVQNCKKMEMTFGNNDTTFTTETPVIEGGITGYVHNKGNANFYSGRFIGIEESFTGSFNKLRKAKKIYTYNQIVDEETKKVSYLTEKEDFLQVGDDPENTYNTFEDALASITKTTETIKVLNDNSVYEPITIPSGKNITINMNDKKLTITQTITNNGTLTIQGTTSKEENLLDNIKTDGIINNGTLTLDKVTFNSPSTTIKANLNTNPINVSNSYLSGSYVIQIDKNQPVTINNSVINSTATAINQNLNGNTVNISNTKITATTTGVYIRNNGVMRLNNCDIYAGTYGVHAPMSKGELEVINSSIYGGDVGFYHNSNNGSPNQTPLTIEGSNISGLNYGLYNRGAILDTTNTTYEVNTTNKDRYAVVCEAYSTCNLNAGTKINAEYASGLYLNSYYPTTMTNTEVNIEFTNGYGIYNYYGTLNINSGTKINANGYQSYGLYQSTAESTTTVNGADIFSENIAVYLGCDNNSTKKFNLNTGTILGKTYGIEQTCASTTTTIGNLNDNVSITNPSVEGGLISINKTAGVVNFYSGLLKGYVKGNPETIDGVREGYEIFDDQDEVQLYIKAQKTYTSNTASQTAISNTPKEGNGYAKVTYEEYDVSADATSETTVSNIQDAYINNSTYNISYSGEEQIITIPKAGTYKLEVWGAQGGYRNNSSYGGNGGYSSGNITLPAKTKLYVYVGGSGRTGGTRGGFNGGGRKSSYPGGGGATDIRINSDSLYARVIVAGGGGSDGASNKAGGYAGGLTGQSRTDNYGSGGNGGTQTSGGTYRATFGQGGSSSFSSGGYPGAGGGGWYGGGGANPDGGGDDDRGGGGGSSYVYTEESAANYPEGCLLNSNYYLTNTELLSGNQTFRGPNGTQELGHSGDGYAKITYLGDDLSNSEYQIRLVTKVGTITNDDLTYNAGDELGNIPSPVIDTNNYEFAGWYLDESYTKKVTTTTTVNSDAVLYAKVNPKESLCTSIIGEEYDYGYTGTEQVKEIICPGKYKLEVWGAEGGSTTYNTYSNVGGKGGYTTGEIQLKSHEKIYINVGGKGNSVDYQQSSGTKNYTFDENYGYNGGGYAVVHTSNSAHAGGGGATHIATKSGLLSELSYFKDRILIVAGGGGGASTHKNYPDYSGDGGSGGGNIGGAGNPSSNKCYHYGTGGTQTTVGTYVVCQSEGQDYRGETVPDVVGFGFGSNYQENFGASGYSYSGGGGGYYGGQSGWHAPGGGGSGYVAISRLENTAMYGYNIDEAYTDNKSNIAYLIEKVEFIVNLTTNERYLNLQDAIDDASNNDTLQFIADDFISYQLSLPADKKITIDMNGFNIITSKSIVNNGNLTITNTKANSISKITNNASIILFSNNATLNLNNITIDAYTGIENAANSTIVLTDTIINGRNYGINNNGIMTLEGSNIYGTNYGIYSNSQRLETINNTSLRSNSNAYYKYNTGTTTITDSTIQGTLNNSRTGLPLDITDTVINGLVRNTGTTSITTSDINYTTTANNESLIYNNGILNLNNNDIIYRYTNTYNSNHYLTAIQNNGTAVADQNNISVTYDYNNTGEFTARYKYIYAIQNYSLLTSTSDTITTKGGNYMYGFYNSSNNNSTITNATITLEKGNYMYGIYNDTGTFTIDNSTVSLTDARQSYGAYMYNGGTVTAKRTNITVANMTAPNNNEPSYGVFGEKGTFILESGGISLYNNRNSYGIYLNTINATYTQGIYDGRGTDAADVSTTNPRISAVGTNSGIGVRMGDGTFNFYDGYITGSTSPRQAGDITSSTDLNYQVSTKHDDESGYDYCILEYNK